MTTELTSAEIKANKNAFATVMAHLVLKYDPAVLKEIEEEKNAATAKQKKSA